MGRKTLLVFLALMISIPCFSGCNIQDRLSDSDMDIYEKIHSYYNKMESYSANLEFTVISNKTENKYTASQIAMGKDKFKINVKNSDNGISVTTIVNGDKAKMVADGSNYSVTLPSKDVLGLLFVNSFFTAYYGSEETSLTVNNAEAQRLTVLETELSCDNKNAARAVLTIDNKTLAPSSISICDLAGNKWIYGTYSDFKYNDKTDESMFSVD